MESLFEMGMLICFGISWPISISKSYRSRTAKGKSIVFSFFILIGYISGILSKVFSHTINYVFAFYILNIVMVAIDCVLYFRNIRLDRANEK